MKRRKKILILLALIAFAAAQAFGLFLLARPAHAQKLTLSETALTLKLDEGRRIVHTVEPEQAGTRLIQYKVTAPDGIVAWVDEKNEMIVALAPGACRVRAILDGQEAFIEVTVSNETMLAGGWIAEDGTALSIADDLSGTLDGGRITWTRAVFDDGEVKNAYRYAKFAADRDGMLLYYDRLTDTLRLDRGGAVVTLVRK